MTTRQKIDRITRDALRQIDQLKAGQTKEFVSLVNKMREQVVLAIAESGEVSALSSPQIKQRIGEIAKSFDEKFQNLLTDNERKVFVKSLQVVDKTVTAGGLSVGVPYLSEQKLEVLKTYNAELITGITNEARKRVAQEIDLAVLGQKSASDVIEAIGRNLKDPSVFGTIAKRAEIIHRTEVNRIQEISTADRMKQVATQIPDLSKQWIHSNVGIPRAGHLALNGMVVKATEKFTLLGGDGKIYMINAPLDPLLPVEEVANCFVGETLIDESNPEAMFKSKYSGEFLTIQTSRGYKITVTPNHPILTSRGLIAAHNLRVGNDVISSPLGELSAVRNPNVNNVPTAFEKKFNSLAVKSVNQRITRGNVNFYGDIPESDVEVVFSNGFLKKSINIPFTEHLRKSDFVSTDVTPALFFPKSTLMQFFKTAFPSDTGFMSSINLFLSLLCAHLIPSQSIGFAGVANINPRIFEPLEDNRSGSPKDSGKFIRRFSGVVKFHETGNINRDVITSCLNTGFKKMSGNGRRSNPQGFSNLMNAFPAIIKPDNISSIDSFHRNNVDVYTMQTAQGIYNANGIFASNCRCKAIPVVLRYLKDKS